MIEAPIQVCAGCGAPNAATAARCDACGRALGAPASPAVEAAELKQVTVLFADVAGFTALSERLDPEDTRQVMGELFSMAAAIVARYEGRIEKFIGDAVMALFGVPAAHEDDPLRALRAAQELRAAVAAMRPAIEARSGVAVSLHCGLNTGIVVTGELQFDRGTAGPLGDTINLAARLMAAAPGGEIWVGPETRRLAEAHFDFDDLGEQAFKGKSHAVAVARLRGARSRGAEAPHRFDGAFVGRHAELGVLLDAVEKVRDHATQVFGVRGEAGSGKTRLLGELRARVGDGVRWIEGRTFAYAQNIPFAALIDLLSRAWGIEEGDRPAEVRAKLLGGLRSLGELPAEVAPLLLHLYQLAQDDGVVIERELFRERLLAAMRAVLAALVRQRPTIVCLQDLHWIDQSTDALLRALVAEPMPSVLLLVNFRPGYTPPPGMTVLDLGELSPRQTRDLLSSLLRADPPEELARFIVERSDGNPFYVEEVVRSLVESGVLVRSADGWTLDRPLEQAGLPPTVRGVIAARIDRLDETRRRVLRHAAVVGREFLYSVVAQVCADLQGVDASLGELQAVDLIRSRRIEPELEYVFKHALTQDVAYAGLLKAERQVLHARTARVMEAVLADRLPEFVETLAYHYQRGGIVDKAVHYLDEAGRKCVERYALHEAASHFQDAYALLQSHAELPGRATLLTRLLGSWSQVHYYEGSIGPWRALLERHLADAERCDDDTLKAMYLGWLGNVRGFNGDARGSIDILDRADALARAAGAREALAYVTAWRAFTLFELGRMDEAIACARSLDQTVAERRRTSYPRVKCQCLLALALAVTGRFSESDAVASELLAFGLAAGSARAQATAHYGRAARALMSFDHEGLVAHATAGADAARDPLFRAMNEVLVITGLVGLGRAPDALRLGLPLAERLRAEGNRWFLSQIEGSLGAARLMQGELSAGLRAMLAAVDDARLQGLVASVAFSANALALTWAGVACRDARPTWKTLLRNPWFTFTQAPFAARKMESLLEAMDEPFRRLSRQRPISAADLALGRLQVHLRRFDDARRSAQRIERWLAAGGAVARPPPLQSLIEAIERAAHAR